MAARLGILGGMGPLASAEFVRSLYEFNLAEREQEMPACILYSDPTIPDRTAAILSGSGEAEEHVVARLEEALGCLVQCGAERIVMTCVTAHYFLPKLKEALRTRVVSLLDVTVDDVRRAAEPHLLFCTNGTRRVGVFEQASGWPDVERYVVLPDEDDQEAVHELLYRVKQGDAGEEQLREVTSLLTKYGVRGLIAGCTEMHLLTKQLDNERYRIADPLMTVARSAGELVNRAG